MQRSRVAEEERSIAQQRLKSSNEHTNSCVF